MIQRLLILAAALVAAGASAEQKVKIVYKAPSAVAGTTMKRMTFGLKPEQVAAIKSLTQGEINMGDVYYTEAKEGEALLMTKGQGFSGYIYPNVPPPIDITEPQPLTGGDPEFKDQWWVNEHRVKDAWQYATGQGVVVADCDGGFNHDEPDLQDNMLLEYARDFSDKENPTVVNDGPYPYHGTAVAAIIAGIRNGMQTNGIAYNSKIVPLQNYNYDDKDDVDKEEALAACILYAINVPGVNVIVLENQMANGSSEAFVGTRDAVRLAMKSGITVVGAGGNFRVELIEEQKDDTGSVIVGALARDNSAASFTNFGERLTVGAYGEYLWTLYGPNGQFGHFGGTSGATPQVAATVALMKEINPLLTPEQMRELLVASRTMDVGNAKAGGRLNLMGAVEMARTTAPDVAAWGEKEIFRKQLMKILSDN